MAITKIEALRRMELYNQGFTDKQMAVKLNATYNAINRWRTCHGLKNNNPYHYDDYQHSVPMEAALTPDQCRSMRAFLGGMINLADRYPDRNFDVMAYMQEYRKAGLVWGEETEMHAKTS